MILAKNYQTNWRYILFVAILAFLAGGGILFFQYWYLPRYMLKEHVPVMIDLSKFREVEEVGEEGEEQEPEEALQTQEISFPSFPENPISEHLVPFDSDIEYKTRNLTFRIEDISEDAVPVTSLDIFQENKKIYELKTGYVTNLLSFAYEDDCYIVLNVFTGGMHCCEASYIFHLDQANNLKFAKYFFIGEFVSLMPDDFFVENERLYLGINDCMFQFFCVHRLEGGNICFHKYYRVEDDNLMLSTADFKQEYIARAQTYETELEKDYQEAKQKAVTKEEAEYYLRFGYWFPDLTGKVVNYLMAGEDELAWEGFEQTFDRFAEVSPDLIEIGVDFPCWSIEEQKLLSPKEIKHGLIESMKLIDEEEAFSPTGGLQELTP